MKIKKMILQLLSLILIVFLLSTVLYAWFSESKTANANGISIEAEDFKIDSTSIEKMDKSDNSFKEFVSSDLGNLLPGDVCYFRIKISVSSPYDIKVSFKNISTSLLKNISFDGDKVFVENYQLEEYNVGIKEVNNVSYSCVSVDDKILYIEDKENSPKMNLAEYKIENVFLAYNLGLNIDASNIDKSLNDGVLIKEFNQAISLVKGDNYYYFALEYNEDLANVAGNSNCYQYQGLNVGRIALTKDDKQ